MFFLFFFFFKQKTAYEMRISDWSSDVCSSDLFALPLAPVSDVFRLDEARTRRVERWDVVESRGTELRLVHLDRWLGAAAAGGSRHVVVAPEAADGYGNVVREVIRREERLLKPPGPCRHGWCGRGSGWEVVWPLAEQQGVRVEI